MTTTKSNIARLIAVPFLISLWVTVLRLIGELRGWSESLFYRPSGGIVPTTTNWIIGITWLAIPFGAYFAYRLFKEENVDINPGKVIGLAISGLCLFYVGVSFVFRLVPLNFPEILLFVWSVAAIAGFIQVFGWRSLFKTLLLYGLASRAVVAIVMFLAMRGNWGTHYDYIDIPPELKANLWSEYFWLAFFPQLTFWVGFTIVVGSLSGGVTLAIMKSRRHERSNPGFSQNN